MDPSNNGRAAEVWKTPVARTAFYQQFFDNYEVSSLGDVRTKATGHVHKGWPDRGDRYWRVRLSCNGIFVSPWVHHLVAETFLGPRPEGMEIDHVDGDIYNNAADNLEYVTHDENVRRYQTRSAAA